MGDFSAEWLALREPADHRARSQALVRELVAWLEDRPSPGPRQLLDLGAGTGSNLRYLAPRLAGAQEWVCVDQDPELLAALIEQTSTWARAQGLVPNPEAGGLRIQGRRQVWQIATRRLDLAVALLGGPAALPLTPGSVVTASALMDLVSEPWLADLIQACRRQGAPLLATLNYDGRVEINPREPLDGLVIALVNGHQGRDKGLGPALGPSAPRALRRLGEAAGYRCLSAECDWELEPDQPAIQQALVTGWAEAARDQVRDAPSVDLSAIGERVASIDRWEDARLGHVAAGRSRLGVGHQDLLLLPPEPGAGSRG
ncbi:MAG: class I SAM-dependent methyltransferase [Bdellovibrio bacteriovorus]